MKKTTMNQLSVAGLLSLAMMSGTVAANPNPGDPYQGKWQTRDFSTAGSLPSNNSVYAGKSYHWNSTQNVYVCKIGTLPGKWVGNQCYSAYRGQVHTGTVFEVLENNPAYPYSWVSFYGNIDNNHLTGNMVVGGSEPGVTLYICRTNYGIDKVVGKYVVGHGCYYEYNGGEHLARHSFEVLVQHNYIPYSGSSTPGGGGGHVGGPYDDGGSNGKGDMH